MSFNPTGNSFGMDSKENLGSCGQSKGGVEPSLNPCVIIIVFVFFPHNSYSFLRLQLDACLPALSACQFIETRDATGGIILRICLGEWEGGVCLG